MRFFPKQVDFFEIFERSSQNLIVASKELVALFEHFDRHDERIKVIHDLEHANDDLTHEVMQQLAKTFLTPIDREDIHALATGLDDIMDLTWASADRVALFKVPATRPRAITLARALKDSTETVHRAIQELRRKKYTALQQTCIDINSLENESDVIFREAIGVLFEQEKDPILLIKWKEILELLELATDKCEDVANTLESIVLKHV